MTPIARLMKRHLFTVPMALLVLLALVMLITQADSRNILPLLPHMWFFVGGWDECSGWPRETLHLNFADLLR